MMPRVVFLCHFIQGYFHSFYFSKLFHYVCLKHVQRPGKTKAGTRTNQAPQYVALEFIKGGREESRGTKQLSSCELGQMWSSQSRGDSPQPSLVPGTLGSPALPQESPQHCQGTHLGWALPLQHLALAEVSESTEHLGR